MAGKRTVTVAGLLLSGGLLAASACSSSTETSSGTTTTAGQATGTTATAAKGISISDVWCRESPAMADAGACYMVITNNEKKADKLTKASVPTSIAGETQIHETVMADGGTTGTTMKMDGMGGGTGTTMAGGMSGGTGTTMAGGMSGGAMKMQEVSSIEIPAGGKVELKPGSYHVMLMELAAPLKVGQTVPITLTFEEAGQQTVNGEVRAS